MRPFLIPSLPVLLLLSAAAFSQDGGEVDLPDAAPVPQELPEGGRGPDAPPGRQVESAAETAGTQQESEQAADEPQELPETQAAPLPPPRPDVFGKQLDSRAADEAPARKPSPTRQSTAMPSDEIACRARLRGTPAAIRT